MLAVRMAGQLSFVPTPLGRRPSVQWSLRLGLKARGADYCTPPFAVH